MTKFNKAACSMQKKKESLAAKKSEAAGQDMQLDLWLPRYSNASKKVYLYVVKPSDFEGWYDVSNEYHDAYEKNAELRNGDVDYEKVRYDVMKQILSGAVKPCEDPMDSHRNFTSLFDSRPYVITQYRQDSLDSKYDECKSEAKKPACSMQKKKESLAKKSEAEGLDSLVGIKDVKEIEKQIDSLGLTFVESGDYAGHIWGYAVYKSPKGEYLQYDYNGTNDACRSVKVYKSKQDFIDAEGYDPEKSESKKSEAYGDFNISDEDVKLTVNYRDVDSHGGSFSVDTPKDGQSYSLQEMKDMVKGMCEDCSGYADISRDGSDILIMVMAPEMDENGEFANDYYAAYTVRCTVRIISTSLETFVDYLDKYNAE